MFVTSRKITLGLCAALCLGTNAAAQDQSVDDKFKPRIYGNLSLAPENTYANTYSNTYSKSYVNSYESSAPRTVIVEPVSTTGITHVVPSSMPSGSYTQQDLQNEAKRVIAFQNSGQTVQQVAPERRYEIELFEPVQTLGGTTVLSSTTQNYATQTITHAQSHIVNEGDTLYNIAKRYNTTVDALRGTNNLSNNAINIGQNIAIPATSRHVISDIPTAVTNQQPKSNIIRTVQPVPSRGVYAVLPKDTLYSISKRACVSVKGIQEQNNLGDQTDISPGQRLNMPSGHCLN